MLSQIPMINLSENFNRDLPPAGTMVHEIRESEVDLLTCNCFLKPFDRLLECSLVGFLNFW